MSSGAREGVEMMTHRCDQRRKTNSSGRHNMSQCVKTTTDLCFKTDSKSVIFSDGSYYVYDWN